MDFLKNKKSTLICFGASFAVLSLSYISFINRCFSTSCEPEFRDGLLKPIFWLTLPLTILLFFFLFFPEAVFRSWFKRIAWWYLLGLIIITLSTPVYSSHILSVDRTAIVFSGVVLLAIITIPYIFWIRRKIK